MDSLQIINKLMPMEKLPQGAHPYYAGTLMKSHSSPSSLSSMTSSTTSNIHVQKDWVIRKYKLDFDSDSECAIELPTTRRILEVFSVDDDAFIYVSIDPDQTATSVHRFIVMGMNKRFSVNNYYNYIGAFSTSGGQRWHVFEV